MHLSRNYLNLRYSSNVLYFHLLQNSIRHNLSLHSKFVRVQNEGTGKSSWWMLNPDTSNAATTNASASSASSGGGQSNKHGSGSKSHLHQHGTGAIGRRRANTLDNW